MLIKVAFTWTLGDASGEAMDQGALQRLLAEMAWFPTAFLDRRHVRWVGVGARRAEAWLTVEGHEAGVFFDFDDEGLPVRVFADRYRDVNGREQSYARFLVEKMEYDRPAPF